MKEKFLSQLQKVFSKIPPEELQRIQSEYYSDFKRKPVYVFKLKWTFPKRVFS